MAPSSTETRVGFESWCKDRYYFLKTKNDRIFSMSDLRFRNGGPEYRKIFPVRRPGIQDFGYFCKNCKDYENKQFDDVCAGCIDSLRYRSEAECPYARRNGRADRIEDAGSQDGTDYQRSACGAQLVARLFSGRCSLEKLSVYQAAAGVKPRMGIYRASAMAPLSHSGLCFPA